MSRLVMVVLAVVLAAGMLAPAAGAPAATPKRGGTLNATFSSDPAHFDPHRGTTAQNFVPLVYNGLVRFKTGTQVRVDEFVIEPDLAQRWEVSRDGLVYTFYLRRGVRFHDKPPVNGRELTSEDVVWSIQRMLEETPENIKRDLFSVIRSAQAVDRYTVRLTLSEPFAPLLDNLATVFASIVPKAEIDYKQVAIGTGPFMLDSFTRGSRYVYKAHPGYFERGQPYLDEIVIHILRDFATRAAALRAGRIDVVDLLPYGQALPIIREGTLAWERYQGIFSVHLRLNASRPPLDNEKVRQALSLALNRQAIAIALGGGEGVVNGPVPTGLGKWALDWRKLPYFTRDVNKARQMLREAGFPNGFTIEGVGGASPDNRRVIMEAIKAQWAQIGVTFNFRLVDTASVQRIRFQKDFTILADNFTLSSDPDSYLFLEYHSKSSGNVGNYADPEVDRLLEAQRRELDPARRLALVHQAQALIAQKGWIITTGDPIYVSLAWPYVRGFRHNNINQYLPLKNVWLDK
ncbi:MAG TPA: ABC transporter substrate-binding protein [bacterium]|nr:ABC transporter substrate-binding protein [bacterium]